MSKNKEEKLQETEETLSQDEMKDSSSGTQTEQEESVSEELSELVKAQAEASEMKDKYLRIYSEFENFRRRSAKERLELIQNANQELLAKLLEVMDDFDRANKSIAEANETSVESLKEGLNLVESKFRKIIDSEGVKKMDAKEKAFDSDFHEAIAKIPAPSKKLKGKVVDVVEDGYTLNEKIIRFAKVVIGE